MLFYFVQKIFCHRVLGFLKESVEYFSWTFFSIMGQERALLLFKKLKSEKEREGTNSFSGTPTTMCVLKRADLLRSEKTWGGNEPVRGSTKIGGGEDSEEKEENFLNNGLGEGLLGVIFPGEKTTSHPLKKEILGR